MELEDDFTDVVRKAMTGHGLGVADVAQRSGLAEAEVEALLGGGFAEGTLRRVAEVLGLDAAALAGLPGYRPAPLHVEGVRRLCLPFGLGGVNAWWVATGETALLFDTGCDAADVASALESGQLAQPGRVFITHGHRDHIGGIAGMVARGIPVHGAAIEGAVSMQPGDSFRCGPLQVTACDLSGHCSPALGYHVVGLQQPLLVAGDAVFAGSIGGCRSVEAYRHALVRLHDVLASLTDGTVILPGHGPATTWGEERRANPFLAVG